ncbi:hypothetical protein CLU95_4148 [Variovorax sp. 54]|uniref:hypothetical protein n=1 Tax=Variovorax sp. 54 TaxID=2035212 RepID=UPI000C37ED4B|nr:hypothetical protein [Variovorax sp. 54]PIF76978.1 hypothetical protein CLU95_4148 [Variovorax sp. 54]
MRKIFKSSVFLLLVSAIVFPTVFSEAKLVLLIAAVFSALNLMLRKPIAIRRESELLWIAFPLLGLLWSLYGVAVGNPGAVRVLSVMFVYPIIFPILAFCYKNGDQDGLVRSMRVSALLLIVLNFSYIYYSTFGGGGWIVDFMQGLFDEAAVVDDASDYFKFTLPNVSSLLFLIPFFLASVLTNYSDRKILDGLLTVGLIIIGVLSGRRALMISVFLGPILAYFLTWRSQKKSGRRAGVSRFVGPLILSCVLGFVIYWFFMSFDRAEFYQVQLLSIFDFEGNESNVERRLQFNALLQGLQESIFFGEGAGAAASYSRSTEQPWAYELSYLAFAFQYGLIGFSIYAAGVLFMVSRLIKIVNFVGRKDFVFCVLCGFFSFLIANATNPYLSKFDYMWVFFIPFALMNLGAPKSAGQLR